MRKLTLTSERVIKYNKTRRVRRRATKELSHHKYHEKRELRKYKGV